MKTTREDQLSLEPGSTTALEFDFPTVEVSQLAEHESWRKEVHRPIYHIHKWWATRLGSVFRAITLAALSPARTNVWKQFYQRHDFSDKVVLDPFMGSGTTLGEATKLGAKVIGGDINPVSTFAVRQAFAHVSEKSLRDAFARLETGVASEIRRYYQTEDPKTGKPIPVLYCFWCKIVTTPEGEVIPLLSRHVFSQDAYPKKKPRAQIVCSACFSITEARYDTTELTCPTCSRRFNPQMGPVDGQYVTDSKGNRHRIKELIANNKTPPEHRLYALMALTETGGKIYLPARPLDLALVREAEERLSREDLPLPTLPVRPGHNTDQARGYNYLHWRDFFLPRQLLCLGLLLRAILKIEDEVVQEQLLCLFSSTLEFNNLFCSFKGEGTGAVRHMFSNHILKPERMPLENSVWGTSKSSGTFSTLFESRLIHAKRYLDQPHELEFEHDLFGKTIGTRKTLASAPMHVCLADTWEQFLTSPNTMMVMNGDSARIPIPDATVDAVITDPPYFDFVHYSELSDFFYAWLAPILSKRYAWMKRMDSFDAGEVQHKDPRVFARQLARVFAECRRVLKDDGVLAFSFHHSRAEGWASIHEALTTAGFFVVAAHPIHAELRAASPKSATVDPISLDAILVCKKQPPDRAITIDAATKCAERLTKRLEDGGLSLSQADRFVVRVSQWLIPLSAQPMTWDEACRILAQAKGAPAGSRVVTTEVSVG